MHTPTQWILKKEDAGYILSRPRPSIFSEAVAVHIPSSAVAQWRRTLSRVSERIRAGRFHPLPVTLGLRCVLGCWRSIGHVQCFGGLRRSFHIVGVGDSLFLLLVSGDLAAYPILRHELESITSQVA